VTDPALDDALLAALREGRLEKEGLLLIFSGAIVQRERSWRSFVRAIRAASLAQDDALNFAARCDRRGTTLEPITPQMSRWRRFRERAAAFASRVRRSSCWAHPLVGVLAAGTYSAAAAIAAVRVRDVPDSHAISPGDALAALSLLATAVVFAAELAAGRLRGFIARRVALSPALAAALTFEVALVVAASWKVSSEAADNRTFVQTLLIVGLVLSLGTAMLGLLRRTDDLRAIDLYARRRRRVFLKAGRQHGRVQASCVVVRDEIRSFGWAKLSLTRAHSERRVPIVAPRRGFVVVDVDSLAAMDESDAWRSQTLRLRVTARLGDIVSAGDEIAGVVPDIGVQVAAGDVAEACRVVSTKPVGSNAEAMEAVGGIVASAAQLASSGDTEAAEQVGDRLIDLLQTSLEASRAARPSPKDGQSVPVSPLARVAVDRALALIRDADDSAVRATMEGILQRVAALGRSHECLAALVVSRFTVVLPAETQGRTHTTILWNAACSAVDADDTYAMSTILARLREFHDHDLAVELVGWIATYEVWARSRWTRDALKWILAAPAREEFCRLVLHRLGATAGVGRAFVAGRRNRLRSRRQGGCYAFVRENRRRRCVRGL
jgi:hypothetical protein